MIRLSDFASYEDARANFRWSVPARCNIAEICCGHWARTDPERPALILPDETGAPRSLTYGALEADVNRCANALVSLGVGRGTAVAIHLGQSLETVAVHLAVYKLGAVAVPLAAVFGPEAISFRMEASGAALLVTGDAGNRMPDLAATVLPVTGPGRNLRDMMAAASSTAETAPTGPDDPAMMIFTSGTTGLPKGALHGHRVLLGHIPGVQMHHDLMPHRGDRLWTPADWAWAGGLLNVLLPGLAMGVPVVAQRQRRFDPEEALDWARVAGVRNAFIPPTALRMMRDTRPKLDLRSVGSGGEQLGAATFDWGRQHLGLTINEFYGQTEANLVLSSCAAWGIATPGIIGRPVPGHDVAVIDEAGTPVPDGAQGTIGIRAPDPVMFLGYHGNEAATAEKFAGDYMTTGDQGVAGPDGIRFVGRDDDVISSAGYRIGPGEIESCLAGHPAIALAAVVGRPDAVRGEIVAAFIRLVPGAAPVDALKADIQTYVRERLSAHEYPRQIEFVDDIPLTSTGKVIRRMFRQG
ncbi:AMP-binding protein [Acuticoccus sp. MNP-M23]|uniref:AMP-binding protein n=1 Tax=Acuticoccus sp. MNP-M23 TaxID=3072793 RepID=UPI0028167697|nr:AMP-binding protein [Acuticoccus sp. MNP-M23]WMS41124.1 AMP-binding protein [Acuticoccus sp. MNP-M23]